MGNLLNIGRGLVGGKKGLLPSGYTQLEYIESVGQTDGTLSPYINTGYKPNPKTFISVDFRTVQCNNLSAGISVFGERIYYMNNMFWLAAPVNDTHNNTLYLENYNGGIFPYMHDIIGKKTHFEYNSNGYNKWNDRVITTTKFTQTHNLELYLFAHNTNGVVYAYKYGNIADIFSLIIKEDDIEVRNFIPCINPQNIVGMYDTVNGAFYSSPNGTAFVAGPEV